MTFDYSAFDFRDIYDMDGRPRRKWTTFFTVLSVGVVVAAILSTSALPPGSAESLATAASINAG